METAHTAVSTAASLAAGTNDNAIFVLIIVVITFVSVIGLLAGFVFHTRSINEKQLEKLLDYYKSAEKAEGNVIWHYSNIASNHALRRNEFWTATIQLIGSIVVVSILAVLLIYRVISAEAALPIISAVSGFGLSRASNLNQADAPKKE